jgi:ubiquinone/menaquinone biosynthesis C-methylase UbiE
LKKEIIEITRINNNPKIISLGCGSARELIEILEEGSVIKPGLFICLDFEQQALNYIETAIGKISFDRKKILNIKYMRRDITSIIRDKKLKDEIRNSHLIYLSGVYDYLGDKMAEKITNELCPFLVKNGKLIICNMSSKNAVHRAYYELLGEWCMIHRTEEEMLRWVREIDGIHAEFAYPSNGENYNFLVIKRVKS